MKVYRKSQHHNLSSRWRRLRQVFGLAVALGTLLCAVSSTRAQPPDDVDVQYQPISAERALQLFGGPTLISLHFKDAPAAAVLAEMSRQSGLVFRTQNAEVVSAMKTKIISIDANQQAFWQAALPIFRKLDLWLAPTAAPREWELQSGFSGPPQRSVVLQRGPFSILLAPQTRAALSYFVLSDPKIIGTTMSGVHPIIDAAQDENNNILLPNSQFRGMMMGLLASLVEQGQMLISTAPPASRKISVLSGSFQMAMIFRSQRWEIPNALRAGTTRYQSGGVDYAVSLAPSENQNFDASERFTVHLHLDQGGLTEANHVAGTLQLLDAEGHAWRRLPATFGGDFKDAQIEFVRPSSTPAADEIAVLVGAPDKLVLDMPVAVKQVMVPFQFQDLPLP